MILFSFSLNCMNGYFVIISCDGSFLFFLLNLHDFLYIYILYWEIYNLYSFIFCVRIFFEKGDKGYHLPKEEHSSRTTERGYSHGFFGGFSMYI